MAVSRAATVVWSSAPVPASLGLKADGPVQLGVTAALKRGDLASGDRSAMIVQ